MKNCIFCKINSGEIASPKVFENENFFVIKDIQPKAKCHYLFIPKKHFKLLSQMDEQGEKNAERYLCHTVNISGHFGTTKWI